jgi:hypothetical protein
MRRNVMKAFTKVNKGRAAFVAVLACMVLAGSLSAFAVPANQVFRVDTLSGFVTFTGGCCFSWNDEVTFNATKPLAPVIVTWSSDYQSSGENQVGISLNGGSCTAYGAGRVPMFFPVAGGDAPFSNISIQWVIKPIDGLVVGENTFTLCGGGSFGNSVTTKLGFRTLTVQVSK